MIRLGWRLAVVGGRSSVVVTSLTAVAVAVGTAILLFALSFEPALTTRFDHVAWRDTLGTLDLATADHGLMLSRTDDHIAGQPLTRMDVAALSSDAPIPPGLDHVPGPGEVYVSPALAALIASTPPEQLGDRFGGLTGQIAPDGLAAPDELAAIVGRVPAALRADGARVVTALDQSRDNLVPHNPVLRILVLISVIGALAPVAVLVATATRLSAARRERRLAALRLAGATPRQVSLFAAVEALAATVPGAIGGVVLFILSRPLVARVPLLQAGWFPEAIEPPLLQAIALLAAVQVIGAIAAVVALRRLNVSPLGVQRHSRPGPLRRRRLVPVAVFLAMFTGSLVILAANRQESEPWLLWTLGGSFFGIIVGIAVAGPWLTALVGRIVARAASGPVALLAGRRLLDDPRASFQAIGGVVMAVFIGSAYLAIASFAVRFTPSQDQLAVRPDVLLAHLPGAAGSQADGAAARLRSTPGVIAVAVLREIAVPDAGDSAFAVVADCASVVATLDASGLSCGPGLEHLGPGGIPITQGKAYSTPYLGGFWTGGPDGVKEVQLSIPADRIDRYAPEALKDRPGSSVLPGVIIDPSAVGAGMASFVPTRMVVRTDGSTAAIERARTVIEAGLPTSVVSTIAEQTADSSALMTELGRVVSLGVIIAMLMAGASLAISVITGLVERKTPFALLRLAGMPVRRLQGVLLLEAAAPLVAVAVLSAALGTLVAQLLLRTLVSSNSGAVIPGPDLGVVVLLAAATVGALAVVVGALPLVPRITDTEATRFE